MSEEETDAGIPTVEVGDLQDAARRWAHARREARRWAAEADQLGDALLPAMEASGLHGVTGEDWVVRVAHRPRYSGSTPERVREIIGHAAGALYVREVVDWAELIRAYGDGIIERVGASRSETTYLALGRPKEEPV